MRVCLSGPSSASQGVSTAEVRNEARSSRRSVPRRERSDWPEPLLSEWARSRPEAFSRPEVSLQMKTLREIASIVKRRKALARPKAAAGEGAQRPSVDLPVHCLFLSTYFFMLDSIRILVSPDKSSQVYDFVI
jgi:hypothetical protein